MYILLPLLNNLLSDTDYLYTINASIDQYVPFFPLILTFLDGVGQGVGWEERN